MAYVIVFWTIVFFVFGCDVRTDYVKKIKYYSWSFGPVNFYFSRDIT